MIVAPAGGGGASPFGEGLGVGVGVGVGVGLGVGVGVGLVGVVPPELEDPEPPEPVNWLVVVLADDDVLALETPHPVNEKAAIDNVPIAQNPFRFNCIMDLSVGGGNADLSGQVRRASTLDVYGEISKWITEFALDMG